MKVLFVKDKYYPFPYANAICVKNVAREMVDDGVERHILAFEDCGIELPLKKDGVIEHKTKMDAGFKRLFFANNSTKSPTASNAVTAEKYSLGRVICNYRASVVSAPNKVKIFIENKRNSSVLQEELKRIYQINIPKYIANTIKGVVFDGE